MSLDLYSCHFPFLLHSSEFCPPLLPSLLLSSSLPSPFLPPLYLPSLPLPSPQHMTEMYGKLHSAFRKVVDIMATGKRYLATYFRVAFFGKVGHATLVDHQSSSLACSRTTVIPSSPDPSSPIHSPLFLPPSSPSATAFNVTSLLS